ncbi:MAG: endonuclease/exonuclease/phosphatase family protein [Pseudomonadota bacterium]
MIHCEISEVQGDSLSSTFSGQQVTVKGIVTILLRKGFYLQTPSKQWNGRESDAIFVFDDGTPPIAGSSLEVSGEVVDYQYHELAKPVTQIKLSSSQRIHFDNPQLEPIELDPTWLATQGDLLRTKLNALEGMLIKLPAKSIFVAPSNTYGDYVCVPPGVTAGLTRSKDNGLVVGDANESAWLPGFRQRDYKLCHQVNVGAELSSDVVGALHYRVDSYQLSVQHRFSVLQHPVEPNQTQLKDTPNSLRVMTLNCFNLDSKVESADKVLNPRQDIDDDWGEGRFHALAKAIVQQAQEPDIVALQEIQDSDGAEQSDRIDAIETYESLLKALKHFSDTTYSYAEIAPELNQDGGQPGGNIRNGFLYKVSSVSLVPDSLRRLGVNDACFEDSRKPLMAEFKHKDSTKTVTLFNVHLASKRHQQSLFSPYEPTLDAKEPVRIQQATVVLDAMAELDSDDKAYYVTGDFNDGEHSETMHVLTSKAARNLVFDLPPDERYDYNHRGKLQVLMHGLVSESLEVLHSAKYEILHGNELIGVQPGETSERASDHAYVMAQLFLD